MREGRAPELREAVNYAGTGVVLIECCSMEGSVDVEAAAAASVMERTPRSAAVRPGAAASMGHTLRSFVISLAIAIALTNTPACGFTIPRLQTNLDSTTDLETGESRQLEVKYDLKTLNDNKTFDISRTKGDLEPTVIAINYHKKADSKNNSNEKDNQTRPNANDTKSNVAADSTIETTTTALFANQNNTGESERSPELTTQSILQTTPLFTDDILENVIGVNKTHEVNTGNDTSRAHSNNTVNGNNITSLETKFNSSLEQTERKDTRSIFGNENKIKNESDITVQNANETHFKEDNSIAKTDAPATSPSDYKTDVTNVTFDTTITEATTTNSTDEIATTDVQPLTLPSWKKYTTIDRKRTSTEVTTAQDKDMVREETAQTRISLEKVFNNTPIPSLEKLRNDLINAQESTTIKLDVTNATEVYVSDNRTSTPFMTNETTKLELVSKRAGYKDNRETTTEKTGEATASLFPPKVSANDTDVYNTMYETEPSEVEVTENKNDTVHESQSQLAEDAIKEELLKEETLNDNEEYAKRYHEDERVTSSRGKQSKHGTNAATEDSLSVKPIGQEKKKNTILYPVSPNYKPLKKIDVQPPKQFIRDPDDNSWRNESISSLGIVFKPKNASKSFTQVLKNKTETELGNMTDNKDSKDDVPDLRVRLEKIAEVRKSKKKINKYGDTVYSDYEESAENVNNSKEDTTSPMSPAMDLFPNFTPPPTPKTTTTEFELTVNPISEFDIFKEDVTTPLTTTKPKKFYNLAEYYDATDEYDADYINAHKIDLKKYTQSLKPKDNHVTQPPQPLHTKPMKEYQPERKATLQYFPPTQKVVQKVNLNDYDGDFDRKVNLYTFKSPPKTMPPAAFGTASPVRTEKYEQVNKVTMKPLYTPMYQTENMDKNLYLTNPSRVTDSPSGFVPNDGNFNRASYVIKHYRDFINEAAKEGDDGNEYLYTEPPIRGVTVNELSKMTTPKDVEDDYDYDVKFRKDIINRFVDNFNQNSERFKVDFPILYNSSVVHRQAPQQGRVASSTAFMKRLYEVQARGAGAGGGRRACEPHCDNMTVELSPAYELHYYVPDQEEKEEMEQRPVTLPYRYRL
ncbi:hypothetical protein B5X24_HaOG207402 [Helicoverpa armigera]|uniref:Uncharacterized protein n=1 Tax=Helicoverpa armigera TaxID=29058 RepID=A0A2W1BP32_HELAM|nr:hypothetical protein B5X24_HaOG207402 [Helicoverpa armigera]